MKLIKPSYKILPQTPSSDGVYKQIELAGRTCYHSENKITEDSAKEFADKMIKRGHLAMCEHGTIYLKDSAFSTNNSYLYKYGRNKYSKVNYHINEESNEIEIYITTNYRVLVENNWVDDLKYICEPTEHHEKRITVKFTTDQGILREFTRHRTFSFAVESTRYCNYSKNKFNNEITFILPNWCDLPNEVIGISNLQYWEFRNNEEYGHVGNLDKNIDLPISKDICRFFDVLKESERKYLQLLNIGWKPQQARNVLPLATKCDMIMTGFVSDWKHFFDLRADGTTGAPHPQVEELAKPLKEEFIKLGYLNGESKEC